MKCIVSHFSLLEAGLGHMTKIYIMVFFKFLIFIHFIFAVTSYIMVLQK